MSARRIIKELHNMQENPDKDFWFEFLDYSDIYNLIAKIKGPPNSPFYEGIFDLKIIFPQNYPFNPPNVSFITNIFHPNISSKGFLCLKILERDWSPYMNLSKVLQSVIYLLEYPNPDDVMNTEVVEIYNVDRLLFDSIARDWVQRYASPDIIANKKYN